MPKNSTNKTWEITQTKNPPQNDDEIVDFLLESRGIISQETKENFLHPQLASITIESVGIDKKQVEVTLARLQIAKKKKELIIIFGDYDVDGITGTAILWESLIALGFQVMPYIPHRVEEGYGLSEKGIENVLTEYPETKLIITVDNGIVANLAVAMATKRKLDVIITDHHVRSKGENSPDALAIVHTTQLCGAGIAWVLSKEIQKKFGAVTSDDSDVHLELATLGTVADLVPLTGANRTIVYHGLKRLAVTERYGLRELFQQAAITDQKIGVYEIGHMIGPRLNAAGRLESAMDSLRLLCTRDRKRAQTLAMQLDLVNQERQQIMHESYIHASSLVAERIKEKKLLVVAHESYEEGVIGLVAGRLVEEYYKPAIVIAKGETTSKGSVRSVKGFNIIEFLRTRSDLFLGVGGHPMAAGFSIQTECIDVVQKMLEDLAETVIAPEILQRKITIDLEMSFNDLSAQLYYKLQELAPFGIGNPEPVFLSRHVLVRQKRIIGRDGRHLRMILQGGDTGKVLEAIAFGLSERENEAIEENYIDIVYTLDENEWQGTKRLQLKIKDFKRSDD
ncbi:MAG TPA: single-stranded-DNA-specific exonuclease RecJ [Patescibacteria group bacterium]|nr:single-stranded-DNA-specific exonuclease RecJ [Patescibacteria group bacterium]